MFKQAVAVGFTLCALLSVTACSQRNDTPSEPSLILPSAAESIADKDENGAVSDESKEKIEEKEVPQEELDEIFGEIPHKYQNYDKYLVAHPKNDTLVTYISVDGEYETIETPLPDYMLTLNDYFFPLRDKYDFPDIDRIVFDEKENMVCVDFTEKVETSIEKDVFDSISKTILENETYHINGVYFEVNMENYPISEK